jgi:Ca2+-binding RTX toxin-like protein
MKRTLLVLAVLAATALGASAALAAQVDGTRGDDTLTGTPDADLIRAFAGSDSLSGLEGNDVLRSGRGDDTADGGPGRDLVYGGRGRDAVSGGAGDDRLYGGWGSDVVSGGEGDDRLHALARDRRRDVLDCGPGNDVAFVRWAERELTETPGCETVKLVRVLTAEQAAGENGDTDAAAE